MNKFEVSLNWEIEEGVSLPLTVSGLHIPRVGDDCGEIWIGQIRSGGELPEKVSMALRKSDEFWSAVEAAI